MYRKIKVLCALVAVLGLSRSDIEAIDARVNLIPNGAINGCANCHVNPAGGGDRNVFGQAVEGLVSAGSASPFWGPALAGADADNDGASNGLELQDPTGAWRPGQPNPGTAAQVTRPGDASSRPQQANRAPTFTAVSAQSVNEGVALTFQVQASDPDSDPVTIAASNLPTGATFSSGAFSWTPGFDQAGNYTVNFAASDGKGGEATLAVSVAVANVNRPPAFTAVSTQSVKEGALLTFQVQVSDPDGDAVTVTASNLPTGATFSNGAFSWTPGFDQAGNYTVTFTASDGTAQATSDASIAVEDALRPLVILSFLPNRTDLVVASGDTVRLSVVAESPDRGPLTYAWTVNTQAQVETGASLLWTSSAGSADDVVSVAVSDGTDSRTQTWTVSKSLKGDLDGDSVVGFNDFLLFAASFGKSPDQPGHHASADLTGDGAVGFNDFLVFVSFFGRRI